MAFEGPYGGKWDGGVAPSVWAGGVPIVQEVTFSLLRKTSGMARSATSAPIGEDRQLRCA
jgi:hypothetical protein